MGTPRKEKQQTTPKGRINEAKKKITAGKVVFDEINEITFNPQARGRSPKTALQKGTPVKQRRGTPQSTKTTATFVEGDQVMKMSVEPADEAIFETNYENNASETEPSGRDVETSGDQDTSESESSSGSEDDTDSDEASGTHIDQLGEESECTPQGRISEIDQEMKDKMLELEKLMVEGGLTKSAKVLKRCMKATASKPQAKNKSRRQKRERCLPKKVKEKKMQSHQVKKG